ncbi:MAG: hypothetical protein WBX25_34985 [Rhodomicrobium sp.]
MASTSDALARALAVFESPPVVKLARQSRLPADTSLLLEIASGEPEALERATAATGRSEAVLKKAAGFFIEQVLLHPGADSYRILGGDRETSHGELRRNMARIMKWLHPDTMPGDAPSAPLNRSLYASRVTRAWESIKTAERRASYDSSLAQKATPIYPHEPNSRRPVAGAEVTPLNAYSGVKVAGPRRPVIRRLETQDFISRLFSLLGSRR